jgi:enamine deaminase RidA (YjgF/YER057c/UK114 family)
MDEGSGERVQQGVISPVEVAAWPRPKGYVNGMITAGRGERVLFVAGQVGWRPELERVDTADFALQFGLALDNVLAVVRAAGGGPESIARMTVYVTDVAEYRASTRAVGKEWRARMGTSFPAMALVGVAALVEEGAKLEIEATAVLPAAEARP